MPQRISIILVGLFLLVGCRGEVGVGPSAVGTGLKLVNYGVGRAALAAEGGIDNEDLANLEAGRLAQIRAKYERRNAQSLTDAQMALLCDLHFKFSDIGRTLQCLAQLETRFQNDEVKLNATFGRRALTLLQTGEYEKAKQISKHLTTDAGRFIAALASAYLGEKAAAENFAADISRHRDPKRSYMGTAAYMAAGSYRKALDVLTNPRSRLLRDYGLSPSRSALGQNVTPAVFRLDLFDEFSFGFFEAFSFAPKANIYVEFMAAKAFAEVGDKPEASRRFDTLINTVGAGFYRDILWLSLFERGKLREKSKNLSGGADDYQRAVELIEGIRSTLSSEAGRIGFLGNRIAPYERLIAVYLKQGQKKLALETVERVKGRSLVDLLFARRKFSVAPSDQARAPQLLQAYSEAEASLLAAIPDLAPQQMARRIARLNLARQHLVNQAPSLASLVSVPPVRFADLSRDARADEAIIVYHQSNKRLYMFCLRDGNLQFVEKPLDGLDSKVFLFRKAIADYESKVYRSGARQLFKQLIEPVRGCLKSKRLTIVPSASIFYLPVAALMDRRGRFLAETHTIRILPSLTMQALLQKFDRKGQRLLAIGNPDLRDKELDLPGAEAEARAVAKMFKQSKLVLRRNATLATLRREGPSYDLIHIASHGLFESREPLNSRLLLAPSDEDSGVLTVTDLYGFTLSANLVVLSACDTAMSEVSVGDELIGLQRGFLYAGSKGLVGSLWPIADEATSSIMVRFYQQVRAGRSPDYALRQAQRFGIKKFRHPFFWAPFQYTGVTI